MLAHHESRLAPVSDATIHTQKPRTIRAATYKKIDFLLACCKAKGNFALMVRRKKLFVYWNHNIYCVIGSLRPTRNSRNSARSPVTTTATGSSSYHITGSGDDRDDVDASISGCVISIDYISLLWV